MIAESQAAEGAPPEALNVLPERIPHELKKRPQWVTWRFARQGEKWTKHPYNPRSEAGRKASSTDLMTWSRFETVFDACTSGDYDGVGFVLSSGDPYTGVDLDGCRDPKTGELAAWAAEIVRELDSYTELSPSGKGLHIVVKGKVPKALKLPRIEMYSMERYFTVTGRAAGISEASA
jgi:primase-polymerase (primpol)-like protein